MTVKAILRTNRKANKEGQHPVAIRLTHKGKLRYFHFGIMLKAADWNNDTRKVRATHPMYAKLNDIIETRIQQVEEVAIIEEQIRPNISAEELRAVIDREVFGGGETQKRCFVAYGKNWAEKLKKERRYSYEAKVNTVFNKLQQYHRNRELPFEALTVSYLKQFQAHLKNDLKNSPNTLNSNIKTLKTAYRNAIEEGLAQQAKNPFFIYSVPGKRKVKKTHLSFKQIRAIAALELSGRLGQLFLGSV